MTQRTKVVSWIVGIILFFGLIFLIWAIDTNRISIFAESSTPTVQDVSELKSLPAPDQSTFSKIYTAIINLFK